MSSSEPHAADAQPPLARPPGGGPALPGALADAARALAAAPADADDAALLASVGGAIVPVLGDVVALYGADDSGRGWLIGVAPIEASAAGRLRDAAERDPAAVAEYVAVAAAGREAVILPGGRVLTGQSLRRAAGLAAEIVTPLGDATTDGVLTIGASDERRQYADAERAAAEVVASLLNAQRTASRQAAYEAVLRQQIDTLAQAGRELAHALNNDLTMPVGVVELLMDRSDFSPDLREMLQAASKDLASLEQHVREFHLLMRARVVN